jgi:hypothetical protein
MTIQIDRTKDALAKTYSELGTFGGLTTGAPGNGATPQNEPGDSDYHRGPVTWSDDGAGTFTGECKVHAGTGTYTHVILCQDDGSMIDYYQFDTPFAVPTAGVVVVDLTYIQS